MSVKTMEARAVISAVDRTGGVLASVASQMRALASASRAVNAVSGPMRAISNASRAVSAAQSGVAVAHGAAMAAAGRVIAPAAIAYGAGRAVSSYADLERRMTRIGITADATREEMTQMTAEAQRMAADFAMPLDDIVEGMDTLAAQGRSLGEIRALLPSVARTAQAAGAKAEDIAKSADAVGTHLKIGATEMQQAFDIMAEGGKMGQFELKDMARYLPTLAPVAKTLGMEGTKGLAQLVGMLQVVRKATGSAEEAATANRDFMEKMFAPDTQKRFEKFGVDLAKELRTARKEGRNLVEVFEELTWKAVKGDLSRLPELMGDIQFRLAGRALLSMRGEWQRYAAAVGQASGTVERDLNRVLGDTKAAMDKLAGSFDRLVKASGEFAVNLGAVKALESAAAAFEGINDGTKRYAEAQARGEEFQSPGQASFNRFMNWLVFGDPSSLSRPDAAAARAEKELLAKLNARREALGRHMADKEREIAGYDKASGATGFMAGFGQGERDLARAAAQKELDGLRGQIAALEASVAARQQAMDRLAEFDEASRRFAGLRINETAAAQPITPGLLSFGRRGWGGLDQTFPAPVSAPLPPARPSDLAPVAPVLQRLEDVLGSKIEAKATLEGRANVDVTVRVEGDGRVTGMGATSTGHIRANVGTSMPQAGAPTGGY